MRMHDDELQTLKDFQFNLPKTILANHISVQSPPSLFLLSCLMSTKSLNVMVCIGLKSVSEISTMPGWSLGPLLFYGFLHRSYVDQNEPEPIHRYCCEHRANCVYAARLEILQCWWYAWSCACPGAVGGVFTFSAAGVFAFHGTFGVYLLYVGL